MRHACEQDKRCARAPQGCQVGESAHRDHALHSKRLNTSFNQSTNRAWHAHLARQGPGKTYVVNWYVVMTTGPCYGLIRELSSIGPTWSPVVEAGSFRILCLLPVACTAANNLSGHEKDHHSCSLRQVQAPLGLSQTDG